jgi:hypothetical protein
VQVVRQKIDFVHNKDLGVLLFEAWIQRTKADIAVSIRLVSLDRPDSP